MTLPDPLITSTPERMGGAPVFSGTRVPVQALFDFLEAGAPLDEFLASYPDITRDHAVRVLKASKATLIASVIEGETYNASEDELACIDRARDRLAHGERATTAEVEAAFARFRS